IIPHQPDRGRFGHDLFSRVIAHYLLLCGTPIPANEKSYTGSQTMNNLNVLLVPYTFPPAGGTGVMRAASLARYLPAEGIRLDVLTARNASAVGSDFALLKEIPAEVTVHRTITLDL